MSKPIYYPELRNEVISALNALSDRAHQARRWGRFEKGVNYYDDLNLNVHILYDDCQVLPLPANAVPAVLHEAEVPAFEALERELAPLLDDLGDQVDAAYMSDPRWSRVVDAATAALKVMRATDEPTHGAPRSS